MTSTEAITLWASTFASVWLLGFQSRNVNSGRYVAAGLTSFCIAGMQIIAIRGIVGADPWTALAITGTSGPLGIMLSIWVHKRMYRHK